MRRKIDLNLVNKVFKQIRLNGKIFILSFILNEQNNVLRLSQKDLMNNIRCKGKVKLIKTLRISGCETD